MKTILVPTDFSDAALYALRVAADIAPKMKARIQLVHVYNLPSGGAEMVGHIRKFYEEIHEYAETRINALKNLAFLKGIPLETYLFDDMLLWQVVTADKFKAVDLIVMGSHGTGGFSRIFIGSNTEKVVRLADAPVLTIKHEIPSFTVNKIVFASNFKEETYPAFEKIRFFAELYNAHLYLLKIITPYNFEPTQVSEKRIGDFAGALNLKEYSMHVFNASQIESGIIDFSDRIGADLIAIETHGRTGLAHIINGSLAEDLVKHEAKPVLSIKIQHQYTLGKELMHVLDDYQNWGKE